MNHLLFAKTFYRNHKNHILFGWFLRLGNFFYQLPYIQKRVRQRRDLAEARYVLNQIGVIMPAKVYINEFKRKKIWRNKFSLGHADDFDVLMLYLLGRVKKPEVIIETGVASGRSSAAILEALRENGRGRLFSVDLPKFYDGQPELYLTKEGRTEHSGFIPKGKQPGWLVPQELRKQWSLILGDSKVELPKLMSQVGKTEIFYHDSEHSYDSMMCEFQTVWPFIPAGGILLSDDVRWNDAFKDFVEQVKPRFHYTYDGLGIVIK